MSHSVGHEPSANRLRPPINRNKLHFVPGGVRIVAEQIQELGADHCIIDTDFGVYTLAEPAEGLREFLAGLLDLGVPVEDIRKLVKTNPERLLGLS